MEQQSTPEEKEQVELSPGQILKQAREQKGLSITELSDMIRVPLNVLEAIEIDRVPKNLPETFIRGYIRSYARKVDVDESLVLTSVETTTVAIQEDEKKEMQSFSRRTKRKAIEKRLKYVTWSIVAVLAIAVIIWWIQDNSQSDIAPVASTAEITAPSVEEQPTEQPEEAQQPDDKLQPEDIQLVAEGGAEKTEQTTEQPSEPVTLTAAEKALLADSGEPDEEGFIKVEMKFANDCWVEVYDVYDERIAVGNKPSGYLMTLNAQGPLRVLLGNPVGVEIWVNGKVYDTSSLPRNRVARFELEAE